ncbi:asparagine synthase-related protein [Rhizobium sp. FKY42]|uniref:asparagine synthase-related protein n=1 Tax=Rhizobium sp. FKY42 TaxID=2562310 RepID=UPI001485B2AC|nr:asparagine synthase-related protein [Rhizobium sp. FKY42]
MAEKISGHRYEIGQVSDAYKLFEEFDGEIFLLEVQHNEHGFNLRLLSNGNGVAPVYFYQNGDLISFDWDSYRLAQTVGHKSLDFQFLCRAIVDPVYTYRTPFSNIQSLPPRTELLWDGSRLAVSQLEGEELNIEIDREDAGSFIIDHVAAYLSKRASPEHKLAVELSGGIDSSFVALAAFRAWQGRGITLGIDIGFGPERGSQLHRRNKVVKAVGCQDFLIDIREYLPTFELSKHDLESRYLLAEEYESAFARIWQIAQERGCNVITGGYGGDELFPALTTDEVRQDKLRGVTEADLSRIESVYEELFTPKAWQALNDGFIGELDAGYLGKSARLAVMKRAPLLLSRGFWPVFPLFDEKLAAALLTATADERHEKSALQQAVKALLGDNDIFGLYEKETLEGASDHSLRANADEVVRLLANSRLIDVGILRGGAIRKDSIGDLSDKGNPYSPVLSVLYATEKFIRWNL